VSGRYSYQQPKRRDIISVLILVGHGSMTFGFAWVLLMDIKRVSFSRVLAVGQAEALEEPKQHREHTMDPAEV
jgi:hypothetical protein